MPTLLIMTFQPDVGLRPLGSGISKYGFPPTPSLQPPISLQDKSLISTTDAHSDFVKTLFVVPSLNLLISGGSDKIVRLWYAIQTPFIVSPQYVFRDLSSAADGKPLQIVGTIDSHTRPIQCLHATATSDKTATLYTADTMGIIRLWELTKQDTEPLYWRSALKREFTHHRTGVNDLHVAPEYMWTGSSIISSSESFLKISTSIHRRDRAACTARRRRRQEDQATTGDNPSRGRQSHSASGTD